MTKEILITLLLLVFAIAVIYPKIIDVDGSGSLESIFNNQIVKVSNYMDERP